MRNKSDQKKKKCLTALVNKETQSSKAELKMNFKEKRKGKGKGKRENIRILGRNTGIQ